MGRTFQGVRSAVCIYCGGDHPAHEDAACGCSCGDEPMWCGRCMAQGGPLSRFGPDSEDDRGFRDEMVDDASDYDEAR